jgi:hypothetical protein
VGDGGGVAGHHGRLGGVEGPAVQGGHDREVAASDQVDEIAVVSGGLAAIGVVEGRAHQVHEGVGPPSGGRDGRARAVAAVFS